MAGKGKRVFTAADLRAMSRGRSITCYPPTGPAQLRISKPNPAKPGRRP
jgi:hypothetical protein